MGDVPLHLKFALKLTYPALKSADFNQYLLITSEPRIGSRPRAFQRAIDEVRTLPLTP